LGDACNIVDGDPGDVRHTLPVPRRLRDAEKRNYGTIERPVFSPAVVREMPAVLAAKSDRLVAFEPLYGFIGTVAEAVDVIDKYQNMGIDLLIYADRRNIAESQGVLSRLSYGGLIDVRTDRLAYL
jgi:hypothetical protein